MPGAGWRGRGERTRTVAVLAEVAVPEDADINAIRADLSKRVEAAVTNAQGVRGIWFVSTILRRR